MKPIIEYVKPVMMFPVFCALFMVPLLFSGCINEEVCEDLESISVRMGFYLVNPDDEDPLPAAIANLSVFGLGKDSLLYDNEVDVGQVELPLDPTTDSCAFVFVYPPPPLPESSPLPSDTIWLIYERIPVLVSMECGFANYFLIDEVKHTRNIIDFIEIEEPNITNSFDEHIKIFPVADPAGD